MASDYLLEIDGIKGESQDSKHPGTIEIASFSWGVTHPGSFSEGTGGGTGKSEFTDLVIAASANKASPILAQACATGKHISKATLYVRKATGEPGQQEYYKITLESVIVSSYHTSGQEGGNSSIPTDQFSLNFAKIEWEYKPQDEKGALGPAIPMSWNIPKLTK